MATTTLIFILGLTSSVTLLISALSLKRPRILVFALLTSIFSGAQYYLHQDLSALLICGVGVLRTITILLSLKWKWLAHWSVIAFYITLTITGFVFVTDWTEPVAWTHYLPLAGAIIASIAYFLSSVLKTKVLIGAAGILWLVYEFNSQLYGQMIGEGLTVITNIVAVVLLVSANRRGVPADELENIDTQIINTITSSIPVVKQALTGQIPIIRADTQPLPVQK